MSYPTMGEGGGGWHGGEGFSEILGGWVGAEGAGRKSLPLLLLGEWVTGWLGGLVGGVQRPTPTPTFLGPWFSISLGGCVS